MVHWRFFPRNCIRSTSIKLNQFIQSTTLEEQRPLCWFKIWQKMSKLSRSRQKRVLDVPPSLSGHPSIDKKLHQKEVSSPVAGTKILMELYGCKQEEGETVRVFAARLNQIAARFALAKLCGCDAIIWCLMLPLRCYIFCCALLGGTKNYNPCVSSKLKMGGQKVSQRVNKSFLCNSDF